MLVIALDTSTPAVTAGLVALNGDGPRSLVERVIVNPRAHGELLTPQLLEVLAEAGHQLAEVDAIVVGAGPGPFTGLRVGMVTAAALGHAVGRPVYPVCGLDAIAVGVADAESVLVVTDARRKEVYWAAYDSSRRTRVTGPHVQSPDDLAERVPGLRVGLAAGEMAETHRDLFGLRAVEPRSPTPEGLVGVAHEEVISGKAPEPLVPLYLRRPDAATPRPPKPVSTGTNTVQGRT